MGIDVVLLDKQNMINFGKVLFMLVGKVKIEKVCKFVLIVKEFGCIIVQLVFVWCFFNENISIVIMGVSWLEQVKENMKVLVIYDKMKKDGMIKVRIDIVLDNVLVVFELFGCWVQ